MKPADNTRKPLDTSAGALMVLLCLVWGLQQVATKAVAADMNPILQVGIRSFVAALMVAALMAWRRESFSLRDGTLAGGLVAGVLFAGEFLGVSAGLMLTSSSHIVVFLYTSPIFAALGLHFFVEGEQLRPAQWAGIALAFIGIVVAFAGALADGGESARGLIGDGLGVLAGISYAATTIVIRRSRLSDAPPTKTLLYQLAGAAVILLPIALATGSARGIAWTGLLWGSLAFQTVGVAFASFLAWFWMLTKYRATQLSVFSFLTPLFGVALGVLLLHETLDSGFVIGALLVMTGIAVVSMRPRPEPEPAAERIPELAS